MTSTPNPAYAAHAAALRMETAAALRRAGLSAADALRILRGGKQT